MNKKIFLIASLFLMCFSTASLFAENEISEYAENRVKEFLTLRIILKGTDDAEALETLTAKREEIRSELEENALDYEQEKCILESFYFMEIYEHSLTLYPEQHGDLRKQMKALMKANIACADKRKHENTSRWLYTVCGDTLSYYMTRSVAATLLHGFKVKGFYEKSVSKDPHIPQGNISLGSWYFYAPAPFGSKRKAEKCYKAAIEGSYTDGEKFLSYEFLSQLYYEKKKTELYEEYFAKAFELGIGRKELEKVKNCNKIGYSLFQYNRNRAGIDEKIPESEMDEDDK